MSLDFPNPAAEVAGGATRAGGRLGVTHPTEAAAFLKALSHEGRLAILCHLAQGERSVTALEHLLGQRQAAVSQQLARLRLEGLVTTRREGKAVHYSIGDPRVLDLVRLMGKLFGEA